MFFNQNLVFQPGLTSGGFSTGFSSMLNPNTLMRQPVYNQILVGFGINQVEFQSIVNACTQAYISGLTPLSNYAANYIKSYLGGEWFVFVSDIGKEDYDFSLTMVKGADIMVFSLDNKRFEVCRLRGW